MKYRDQSEIIRIRTVTHFQVALVLSSYVRIQKLRRKGKMLFLREIAIVQGFLERVKEMF